VLGPNAGSSASRPSHHIQRLHAHVAAVINGQTVAIGIDTGSQGTIITPEYGQISEPAGRPQSFYHAFLGQVAEPGVNNAVLEKLEFGGVAYAQKSLPVIALGQPLADPGRAQPMCPMAGLVRRRPSVSLRFGLQCPDRTITLFYRVSDCTKGSHLGKDPCSGAWFRSRARALCEFRSKSMGFP